MPFKKKRIAIVGMACRLPGDIQSPEDYWQVLKKGKDVVTTINSDRWGTDFYQHPDKKEPGKSYTFAAGVLSDIDRFDADFFGISPREAAQMDPQQRLLLELTWEALENGGQRPEDLAGSKCAVYVGIASTDYAHRRMDDLSSLDPYSMTGNTASIASNRISYLFDLHGPSVSVDTACSSSLVALHHACNSIWSGDAPIAIAGGVNLLLHPFGFVGFSKASMLSPRGRCHAFDDSGDGYVRSEGSGVLFLKPLEDAITDGDPVQAIIVESGINCDGHTNGISLPSSAGQGELLQEVYTNAGIDLDDISYIEAHGTGTAVGDPIETSAIAEVLAKPRKAYLPIGSAKTNVGHLETASGMAGVFKIIMSLKNRALPKSLHFNTPNKNIDFEASNLKVVTRFTPLPKSKRPLLMGVNSFGFGGANAHILLEEFILGETAELHSLQKPGVPPLFLSANSDDALKATARQYVDLLKNDAENQTEKSAEDHAEYYAKYYDLAYSASHYRQHLKQGLAINGKDRDEILEKLSNYVDQGETPAGITTTRKLKDTPKLALVFSGNGSQWQGMGCELLKSEPIFRATVKEIDKLLTVHSEDPISLIDEFNTSVEDSRLEYTEVAQLLLFALQVGMINVLNAQGLKAQATLGHSVGEVSAAWAAGALTLEQAVEVIYERSHAQGETKGSGRMAAAGMGHEAMQKTLALLQLDKTITIAGINSANATTLSGSLADLEQLSETLAEQNIFYRILDLVYAFHSPEMLSIEERVKTKLYGLTPHNTTIRFVSTVTGSDLAGERLDATYWWENIRKPVLFNDAMDTLLDDGFSVFLEIGPHPILRTYINECCRTKEVTGLALSTQTRKTASLPALLDGLYTTYLAGCALDMSLLFPKKGNYIQLPNYPWQREKHWYTLTGEGADLVNRKREHPLLGYRIKSATAQWENQLDTHKLPYLKDHRVDGGVIFPAAGYVEMALAASALWFNNGDNSDAIELESCEIENIEIKAPIVLDNAKSTRFTLLTDDGSFTIESRDRMSDNPWTLNVVGRLLGATNRKAPPPLKTKTIIKKAALQISKAGHYQLTESVGLSYGAGFQGVEDVWVSSVPATDSETLTALAQLEIPADINQDYANYHLHPSMLDAGFQILVDVFAEDISKGKQAALIPVQIGKLYQYEQVADIRYLQVNICKRSPQSVVADFLLLNKKGDVLVELHACRFKGVQFAQSRVVDPATYVFNPVLMPQKSQQLISPKLDLPDLSNHVKKYLTTQEPDLQRTHHFQQIMPLFDVMMTAFAWQAIHSLQPSQAHHSTASFSVEELAEKATIASSYIPLLTRLLRLLETDDLAYCEKGQWHLSKQADLPQAEDIWLSILGDSPAYLPELMLIGRCGTHLIEVIQGKQDANELLFPEKSSIQSHWYHASQSFTAMNLALGEIVKKMLAVWPKNRRLRILEVGGGDAGLTRQLLSILSTQATQSTQASEHARQCDYLFTDSSEDAVAKAGFELEDWDFLNTQVLDIEHDIDTLNPNSFDLIIAGNTFYQANNLHTALSNTQQLLAPQGTLLVLERQPDAFSDLTLGLDPQWWAHTTEADHPLSLLLSQQEWQSALQRAHFENITPVIEPKAFTDEGAFLIMASAQLVEAAGMDTDVGAVNNAAEQDESPKSQTWLLLTDSSGLSQQLGQRLSRLLQDRNQQILWVETADEFLQLDDMHFQVNIHEADAFESLFNALQDQDIQCNHVIQLSGLQQEISKNPLALQQQRCVSTTDLIQSIEKHHSETLPQLWLVTSEAVVIDHAIHATKDEQAFSYSKPEQTPLWGLGRVIMNEHPDLNCKLIDLQLKDVQLAAELLLTEVLDEPADDNEIILAKDSRHVMRMQCVSLAVNTADATKQQPSASLQEEEGGGDGEIEAAKVAMGLSFKSPGPLKNLYWQTLPEQQLANDEIEIKPYATGLNFRDVMYAMGMLSDEAVENGFAGPTLGMELSGKVVSTGKNITEYKPGDDVIGFAPACFSTRVITQTTAIAHKPKDWSYAETATIPTTFFTVYYALHHLAQIQPGEKILIHGAAGGVGIAAIQFARYRGAEIFATAGSDEKREFVRLLGADHVLDSRSLAFADDIMKITHDEGIDIVLNSLAGEAINRNLSILKPFGRFLELGKRDFYENSKIGLRPFRNNISYFGIDADQLLIERADLAAQLFNEMMGLFSEGVLRPLPHRVFPASQIEDAFRYMQQSRQIGKVIVSFQGEANELPIPEIPAQPQAPLVCDPKGSYLVTGGLSGFGLETAHWLADKGAKTIILASRSGKPPAESEAILKALQKRNISVELRACDVADKQAVATLFAEFNNELPKLKGVIHAAMVLDDGLIRSMSHEQFNKVLSPKVAGAWNLHEATLTLEVSKNPNDKQSNNTDLDFFVLYSSATTFLGNPGQANYVAGNMFLESLASYRRADNLPATYAAWGAIGDVGFLARNEEVKEALQSRLGGSVLSSQQALSMLEKLIASDITGAAIIDFDWNVIQRIMPGARAPKYIEQQRQVRHTDSDHLEDIQTLIADMDAEETQELITGLLLTEIEQILRLPREKLDLNSSVFDLGMDSLMGMELVLAIEERFAVKLPVMALTEGATISRIAERICGQLLTSDNETDVAKDTSTSKQTQHEEAVAIAAARHTEDIDTDELEKITKALDEESKKAGHG